MKVVPPFMKVVTPFMKVVTPFMKVGALKIRGLQPLTSGCNPRKLEDLNNLSRMISLPNLSSSTTVFAKNPKFHAATFRLSAAEPALVAY
jgi:hypothetical protein